MKLLRFLPAAVVLAGGLAVPSQATVVNMTLSGSTAGFFSSGLSESSYTTQQQDYLDQSYANSGAYNFKISYDTSTVGVPLGTGFYSFAATLVSGSSGSYTNFSGFTASIDQQINTGSNPDLIYIRLHREDLYVPSNFNRFTSDFTFVLGDTQGLLYATPSQLPSSINPASLEQFTAELRISRTSGNYIYKNGSVSLAIDPAVGAVPEPASWAMLIAGFGMIGTSLRARRSSARALA